MANHCFRFVPRQLLSIHAGATDWEVNNTNSAWAGCAEQDQDAVLLVKSAMSARYITQMPLLVLPHTVAMALDPSELELFPLNELTKEAARDLRF